MKNDKYTGAEKAIMILLSFTSSNIGMRNLDLSKKLGFNVSTVNRNLKILCDYNLVQQNSFTKKYSLGPAVYKLGKAYKKSLNKRFIDIAEPHMIALRDLTNETIALVVSKQGKFYIENEIRSKSHINVSTFPPGSSPPWNIAATTKVLLAFSDEELVQMYLKQKMHRYTPNTIITKKEYIAVLEKARKEGVAYDFGEHWEDVYAIGAPVFGINKAVVGALAIVGPAYRMKEQMKSLIPQIKKTAGKISKEINL